MRDRDAEEPSEVFVVECQQLRNTMHQHCGNEPRVMHLDTRNRVSEDKPTPLRMNPFIVRYQSEPAFKQLRSFVGLGWR